MMLSVMVVGAGAAFSDQSKIKNTEAVDACTALNIIGGYPDGSFKPEGNITRAEVTKMICVALNGGKNPAVSTNTTPTFSDVRNNANAAWAEGYIESCAAQGIVSGVGGGKFAPNGNVTGVQLAKMLLVSLGYKSENEGFTGNAWATNVNTIASAKGLYEGLEKLDVSAALTRDSAARMIWNALQAYEVEYKTSLIAGPDGKLSTQITVQDKVVGSTNDKITLLRDKYDAWMNVGTLVKVDGKDLTIDMNPADRAASDLYSKDVDIKENQSLDFTKLGTDYSALMGQKVKVIFKNGKTNDVLGVYATTDNTVYNTVVNAIEKDGTKVKFDGNSYSVENKGIDVYVDGTSVAKNVSLNNFDDAVGTKIVTSLVSDNCQSPNFIKFVDSDDNGKIDTALITTVTIAKVTYASSKEIIAGSVSYKYEDENIAKDIAKDDYVVITNNLFDECKDVVKAEKLSNVSMSGKKVNPDKYQLDGKWYVMGVGANMNSVAAGNKVDAWVYNGVVAYAKRTSGESGTIGDICVITAKGTNIEGDKVKIATFDGKETIVTYDDDDYSSTTDLNNRYVAPSALAVGEVYEYEVVKGEYRFQKLSTTDDWYGDYTAKLDGLTANWKTVSSAENLSTKWTVDDSAKVILIDSKKKTKLVTGKQAKSLTVGSATGNILNTENQGLHAYFTSKVDGVTRVTYAVVEVAGSNSSSFSTNDNYAYITDSAYQSSTGYITYKVWTGEKEETVTEKKSNTNIRSAGTVIGYSSIKDGEIEDVTADLSLTAGAVQGINEKQTKISFDGSTQHDITSDTVILYVDTDKHEGQAGGSIVEANKFGNTYFNNVYYKLDSSGDVELLVVDVKNMLNGEITMATPSVADLNTALKNGDVTVTGTLTAGDISVPANTTLDLTAVTVAKGATVTLDKEGAVILPNGKKVDAKALKATGDLVLTANKTGGVTVAAAAVGTQITVPTGGITLGPKDDQNFYDSSKSSLGANVTAGTYTWTAKVSSSAAGWVAKA